MIHHQLLLFWRGWLQMYWVMRHQWLSIDTNLSRISTSSFDLVVFIRVLFIPHLSTLIHILPKISTHSCDFLLFHFWIIRYDFSSLDFNKNHKRSYSTTLPTLTQSFCLFTSFPFSFLWYQIWSLSVSLVGSSDFILLLKLFIRCFFLFRKGIPNFRYLFH